MKYESLDIIHDEHRALAAMLSGLRTLVAAIAAGRLQPDFDLLAAMIRYIDEVPEKLHHPKEDQYLFAKLRLRCPDALPYIEQLEEEHRHGGERIATLNAALRSYREQGEAVAGYVVHRSAFPLLINIGNGLKIEPVEFVRHFQISDRPDHVGMPFLEMLGHLQAGGGDLACSGFQGGGSDFLGDGGGNGQICHGVLWHQLVVGARVEAACNAAAWRSRSVQMGCSRPRKALPTSGSTLTRAPSSSSPISKYSPAPRLAKSLATSSTVCS